MRGRDIIYAWLTTAAVGGMLHFPAIGFVEWVMDGSQPFDSTDWELLAGLPVAAVWLGGISAYLGIPATVALWLGYYARLRNRLTGASLRYAAVGLQLLTAVLTFAYIAFFGDGHGMARTELATISVLYTAVGALLLNWYGLRAERRKSGAAGPAA